MKTVAIIGSEPSTQHLVPYDDLSIDIWTMNQQSRVAKRVTAALQIHVKAIYGDPLNKHDINHWDFLKSPRDYPMYMQEPDPEVPNSVRYPLKEILEKYPCEKRMFTQTACYSLALALYMGYEKVLIYGIENAHYSEYSTEREGFIYWIGFLQGHGVIVERHSGDNMFDNPLYGRERLWVQNPETYSTRLVDLELQIRKLTRKLAKDKDKTFEIWNKTLYDLGVVEGRKQQCTKFMEMVKQQIKDTGNAVIIPSELTFDRQELNGLIIHGGRQMAAAQGKNNVQEYTETALKTAICVGRLLEIDDMKKEGEAWQLQTDTQL